MAIKDITSEQNPSFKTFTRILSGRGLKKHGLSLASGPKQVAEIISDFREICEGVIVPKGKDALPDIPEDLPLYRLDNDLFRGVDVYGTGPPLLLVRVDALPVWDEAVWPKGCTLFIPFQDPSNVGAVLRTAAALGVAQAVVLKEAANPLHHRSLRTAGSAVFRLPIASGPSINDLEEFLHGQDKRIFALDPMGKNIIGYKFPDSFGFLPGIEGPGFPKELNKIKKLSIPMQPGVESLNAAMAVGIALFEWRREMDR